MDVPECILKIKFVDEPDLWIGMSRAQGRRLILMVMVCADSLARCSYPQSPNTEFNYCTVV